MEVEPSPPSAKNGLSCAEQVVRETNTRLDESCPCREARERHTGVPLVPQEAAVVGRFATRVVLRVIENRVSCPGSVRPRCKVRDPEAKIERQALVEFPGILDKTFKRRIRDIVDAVER